jgi:hypothetical protein
MHGGAEGSGAPKGNQNAFKEAGIRGRRLKNTAKYVASLATQKTSWTTLNLDVVGKAFQI